MSKIEIRFDPEAVAVLQDGLALSPSARVTMTAAELAVLVRDWAWVGVEAGRRVGSKATANVAAGLLQATADATYRAGAQAGARLGAEAGVAAGADYAIANSRVRRELERDADGRVVASVESREPIPTKGSQ